MKFRYTILYVSNVTETMDFYEAAFGLRRLMLHESGGYGEMETGETKLAFAARETIAAFGKAPRAPNPAHPSFEIAFETDDVRASLSRALAAGAKLVQDAQDEPWGQVTSYVTDPDGFLVEICSPIGAPS